MHDTVRALDLLYTFRSYWNIRSFVAATVAPDSPSGITTIWTHKRKLPNVVRISGLCLFRFHFLSFSSLTSRPTDAYFCNFHSARHRGKCPYIIFVFLWKYTFSSYVLKVFATSLIVTIFKLNYVRISNEMCKLISLSNREKSILAIKPQRN